MKLLLMIAMEAEARPIIEALSLKRDESLGDRSLPFEHYRGKLGQNEVFLTSQGRSALHGVDNIGTDAATLSAYISLRATKPDWCINAGTAGGFVRQGAAVGDVYLSGGTFRFHDRRISIAGFDRLGVGSYPSADVSGLAKKLGLKVGSVSTGGSLDLHDCDAKALEQFDAHAKEMEAGAIAWVAWMLGVPFFAVKSITDLVDGPHPSHEEFLRNLALSSQRLKDAVLAVIQELAKT